MKNVYETPLRYKNFNGVERTTKVHFHLTPREFTDWMVEKPHAAQDLMNTFSNFEEIDGDATTDQKMSMLRLVKILAELSYGVPDEDGEVFDKSGLSKFIYSAAYDSFRMFLFENMNELSTFVSTLLNQEVIAEFSQRMEAINAQNAQNEIAAAPAKPAEPKKDPHNMSREELVAAMQQRNQQYQQ